jgi:hypothetical protein
MREPVVRHELDPRARHIHRRGFLVVAVGFLRKSRHAEPGGAAVVVAAAREQRAADHLRIGDQQRETLAVTVARNLVEAGLRKERLVLRVVREQRPGRSHQRGLHVVADAGQRPAPDQIPLAELLRAGARHRCS